MQNEKREENSNFVLSSSLGLQQHPTVHTTNNTTSLIEQQEQQENNSNNNNNEVWIKYDGSFGLITDDVFEHCILPFVEYRELILTIPLVCSKWKQMADKSLLWFNIVLKESKLHSTILTSYVNNCKYLCKIKKDKQELMNDEEESDYSTSESLLLSDDIYILKRLLYIIPDYFPTRFITPSEDDDREFYQKGLISRDDKDPNLLIYNRRSVEAYRAFSYDMNLRTDKRIPNLTFKPPVPKKPKEEEKDQEASSSTSSLFPEIIPSNLITTTISELTSTPPVEKITSNYLLEELVPIYYFEVETIILEKPEPVTPVTPITPLSSTSSSSANSFWRNAMAAKKNKVKDGRNSIGIIHNKYLGNRQVGWDDLSAGFHSDDGGIFLEEGSCKFKVDTDGKEIVVGDVLGCGFSSYHKAVFFTLNGKFLTSPVLINTMKEDMRFGLGFWKNMKAKCNFGNQPFRYDISKALSDITNFLQDPECFTHPLYDSEMTYSDEEKLSGLVEKLTSLRNRIESANQFLADIQRRIQMRELGIDSDSGEDMTEDDDEDYVDDGMEVDESSSDEEEIPTWNDVIQENNSENQQEETREDYISEEEGSFSD